MGSRGPVSSLMLVKVNEGNENTLRASCSKHTDVYGDI